MSDESEDPRIRRWREREEERLERIARTQTVDEERIGPLYERKIRLPGLLEVTKRAWLNPILWLAALMILIELVVFGLGNWQLYEDPDKAWYNRNPVRVTVVDALAFRAYRPDDFAATRITRSARQDCRRLAREGGLDRLGPRRTCSRFIAMERDLKPFEVLGQFDAKRLLPSVILHLNPWHLIVNVFVFLILAPMAVARMGSIRFLIFFAATGVAGNAALWLISGMSWAGYPLGGHHPFVPVVGASGAIFGLLAAALRDQWRRSSAAREPFTGFGPVPWLIRTQFWLIILNVLFMFMETVAWEAHLGGFVAGWFLAPWLRRSREDFREMLRRVNGRTKFSLPEASSAPLSD